MFTATTRTYRLTPFGSPVSDVVDMFAGTVIGALQLRRLVEVCMRYSVMAAPPFDAGAAQDTMSEPSLGTTTSERT